MGKVIQFFVKILLSSFLKDATTLKFLQGYRSYLSGVALILAGVTGLLGGVSAGEYQIAAVSPEVAQGMIISGLGIIFAARHQGSSTKE